MFFFVLKVQEGRSAAGSHAQLILPYDDVTTVKEEKTALLFFTDMEKLLHTDEYANMHTIYRCLGMKKMITRKASLYADSNYVYSVRRALTATAKLLESSNSNNQTNASASSQPSTSKGLKLVPHSRSLKVWQAMAENMKRTDSKVEPDIQIPKTNEQISTSTNTSLSLPRGIRLVPHSSSIKLWNVMARNIKDKGGGDKK